MGKKTLWAVILLLLTAPLYAHDFNFSWVEPTARTDGTALNPATEIKSYKMRCEGPENAERIVDRAITTPLADQRRQYLWTNAVQASGLYDCKMSAIDTGDLESPWSNTVSGIPKFDPPAPPTDFRRNE
jgi:hypothetical protein